MQGALVWLPTPGVGPGSGRAKSTPRPGSGETPESAVSAGPGSLGAAIYSTNDVLVHD